jgi:hypothetical protein
VISGLLFVALAACLVAAAGSSAAISVQISFGALALGAFCAGLLFLMSVIGGYGGLGLRTWRIGPWSLAWAAIAFGLATISWVSPQAGIQAEILPTNILRAMWLVAVAMALFTSGYCSVPHLARASTKWVRKTLTCRFTDDIRGPFVPWILFGTGVAANLAFAVTTGHLGYVGLSSASTVTATGYSQFLALLGDCLPLAVAAAAVRAYRTRLRAAWLTLAVMFVADVAAGATEGFKSAFIVTILAVSIPRTMIRGKFPIGALAAAVAFFLLIVIPFNQSYRAATRGDVTRSTTQTIAVAPTIAGQVLASDLSPVVLGESADSLAERIRTIDSPAIIMQRTPSQIPYSNPDQLVLSPLMDLIPRALWPGKPLSEAGYQMSQDYYQLPPQVFTSSAITPEGDLYRHGGWLMLIVGMFLIGVIVRLIDEMADLRQSMQGAFLIILFFPRLVQPEDDVVSLMAGIPSMLLLWIGVTSLSFSRRIRRPGGGA